jgi:hypothetical protein
VRWLRLGGWATTHLLFGVTLLVLAFGLRGQSRRGSPTEAVSRTSGKSSPQTKERCAPEPADSDAVLKASIESFPASDAPAWPPIRGPNAKATPVVHGRETKTRRS